MSIKNWIRSFKYRLKDLITKNSLKVYWDKGTNFGDAFNPHLISKLSKKKVSWVHKNYYPNEYILCIGSILQKANSNAIIWGSGLISEEVELKEKPKKIYAVRGPKTRERLLEMGIDCPKVYGDPALLIPLVYKPEIKKIYKLGIIPHYVDKFNPLLQKFSDDNILILDIKMKNHYEFIDQVLSCEKIVSSSLHGIILADAYKIPSIWIEFSDKVKGKGFKFLDYFMSVNRIDRKPFKITKNTKLNDLFDLFYNYKIDIDLSKLIKSCPFKIDSRNN